MGLKLKVLRGKTVGKAVFAFDSEGGMEASWTLSTGDTGAELIMKLDRMLRFLRTFYEADEQVVAQPARMASVHMLKPPPPEQAPELPVQAEAISLMQRLGMSPEQALAGDIARAEELGYEMIPPGEQELL